MSLPKSLKQELAEAKEAELKKRLDSRIEDDQNDKAPKVVVKSKKLNK